MRKYLFAGLIILLPLILTIFLVVFLVNLFTYPFLDIVSQFLERFNIPLAKDVVPVLSRIVILLFLVFLIFVLGVLARWFFFKSFINLANTIFSRIPFVKSIFHVSKDIVDALFGGEGRKAFKYTTLVPFPMDHSHCIGFVSGEIPEECKKKVKEKLLPVFVPTAPHPISGYLLMVPEKILNKIDMTNEDAVKFTVSCGIIVPEEQKTHTNILDDV